MAIIRNDRRAREAAERQAGDAGAELEEDVDYGWHPTAEELPDPIPQERWLAMLDDPEVFDEDALQAVRCVDDYGEPVTFQKLSVKYRGTMGRYRRWLYGLAERAARHEGREPLGRDRFGQDEWWPYLLRQRLSGKAAANVHEMLLQPELAEALRSHAARDARSRAKGGQGVVVEPVLRQRREAARTPDGWASEAGERAQDRGARPDDAPAPRGDEGRPETARPHKVVLEAPAPVEPQGGGATGLESLTAFLRTMAALAARRADAARPSPAVGRAPGGEAQPLDYARRYAGRIHEALGLVAEGLPTLTAAQVARSLGDESVGELEGYLNAAAIPGFAYLDRLCDLLFLDAARLEAPDALAGSMPVFRTVRERYGADGAAAALARDVPEEVVFVVDDSAQRRSGAIVRLSELRCALLEREPVFANADRFEDPALAAYVRLVHDVEACARAGTLRTRSVTIAAAEWDALSAGRLWPGAPA